jgi:hypothetical protein
MITCQHEWVKQCQIKYRFEALPEGEHWEDAHYPVPECLGGTETVRLWSRDHAVHGVLQSEGFNHPCLHHINTESDRNQIETHYPEYSYLFDRWTFKLKSRAGQIGGALTHILHPDLHSKVMKEVHNNYPDMAKNNGKNNIKYARKALTKETLTKNGKITTSQQWMCIITGKIAAPPHLSNYQKSRGIDPRFRVRVDDLLSQQLPIILAGI